MIAKSIEHHRDHRVQSDVLGRLFSERRSGGLIVGNNSISPPSSQRTISGQIQVDKPQKGQGWIPTCSIFVEGLLERPVLRGVPVDRPGDVPGSLSLAQVKGIRALRSRAFSSSSPAGSRWETIAIAKGRWWRVRVQSSRAPIKP